MWEFYWSHGVLIVMPHIVHIDHRFAVFLSHWMMDISWLLLITIIELASTEVSCQPSFGNPPPLPEKGLLYCFKQ